MRDICKQWYKDYKKKYNENIHLFNTDVSKCLKAITGMGIDSAVWRYLEIHGCIDRMGGFANFSHYVNKCAEEDYLAHRNLEKQNKELRDLLTIAMPIMEVNWLGNKYFKRVNKILDDNEVKQ